MDNSKSKREHIKKDNVFCGMNVELSAGLPEGVTSLGVTPLSGTVSQHIFLWANGATDPSKVQAMLK
jgi:hypothetical protein